MMGSVELVLWGAYLGVAGLLLASSLLLYALARARVAFEFSLGVVVATAYVLVQLGWVSVFEGLERDRWLADVGLASAAFLGLLLTRLLRVEHSERRLQLSAYAIVALGSLALLLSLTLQAHAALELAAVMVTVSGCLGVLVCLLAVWYGDRLASVIALACVFMTLSAAGLTWIALHSESPMPLWLHAVSALAACSYLALLAWASWMRYHYKVEMRLAMRNAQSYDPLTRMSSSAGTARLLNAAIRHSRQTGSPIGVISITIANLHALNGLHGAEFVNRALYAFAWRLRSRIAGAEAVGRIGDDSFLIISGRLTDQQRFARRGPRLVEELSRPISLGTVTLSGGATNVEWQAELGVGVLWIDEDPPDIGKVLSMARSLAVSALSFSGRVARFDAGGGHIVELSSGFKR